MADKYTPGLEYQSWQSVIPPEDKTNPGLLGGLLAAAIIGKEGAAKNVFQNYLNQKFGLQPNKGLGINPDAATGTGVGVPPPGQTVSAPINSVGVPPSRSVTPPTVTSSPANTQPDGSQIDLKGFIGKLFPNAPN